MMRALLKKAKRYEFNDISKGITWRKMHVMQFSTSNELDGWMLEKKCTQICKTKLLRVPKLVSNKLYGTICEIFKLTSLVKIIFQIKLHVISC